MNLGFIIMTPWQKCNQWSDINIHKEKSNKMQQCIKIFIPHLYEAQHVPGDIPPIIRSLQLHWQPLVFHTRKVVGRVAGGQRPPATRPTTFLV